MLKDLTREDWLAFLDLDPERIPPVLLLSRNAQSADALRASSCSVVATEAGCGEGAASCYSPGLEHAAATPELVDWACGTDGIEVPRHRGRIWTTAALLAEGDAETAAWHRAGYLAVDMETATTFAVAEHFRMWRVSLLVVFDNPREGAHLAMTEHDKAEARARGEAAMRRLVFRSSRGLGG